MSTAASHAQTARAFGGAILKSGLYTYKNIIEIWDPPASGALLKSLALQSAKYLSVRGPMKRQNVWNQASDQVTGLCARNIPIHAVSAIWGTRGVSVGALDSCW